MRSNGLERKMLRDVRGRTRMRSVQMFSNPESLNAADEEWRFGQENKRHEEGEEDTTEKNEGKFSSWCLNNRSFFVLDECHDHKYCQQNSEKRYSDWDKCVDGIPSHILFWKLEAAGFVHLMRPPAIRTFFTWKFVSYKLLILTRITYPTTAISLLHDFNLSHLTWMRTHRLWYWRWSLIP